MNIYEKAKLEKSNLTNYETQTIPKIFWLARTYFKDLLLQNKYNRNIQLMSPREFFQFIKGMEYVADKDEYLNRPGISIELSGTGHYFDCDDRTILSLSFFMLKNWILGYKRYDFRILVTGRYESPRHVFIEFRDTKQNSSWIPFDPTYPHNVFGKYLYTPKYLKIFYE